MLYFEKTSDRTLSGSYILPKQHFETSKILKSQKKRNSFKTIHDFHNARKFQRTGNDIHASEAEKANW